MQGPSAPDVEPGTQQNLTAATVGALRWNYVGVATRAGAALAINVVLARLLGPEPFGLIAIAWMVIGLGRLFSDFGVGAALVQSKHLHDDDIRFTFGLQFGMGMLLAGSVALGAGTLGAFFRRQDAAPVLAAMAAIFVLQAFGQTAGNLLRRGLRFRELQMAQVASYLIGYLAIGIPSAIAGLGVWSLVAAQLSQSALHSLLLYLRARHSIIPSRRPRTHGLMGFGGAVLGTNLANWVIDYIDTAVVGRAFGILDLGIYNRALALLNAPTSAGLSGMQAVLFPAYSRAQSCPDALRRAYLVSVRAMAILVIPPLVCVAVVPHTVILGLYGPRWVAATPLVLPLALAMIIYSLTGLGGPLLWGVGRVSLELRAQWTVAVLALLLFGLASRFSILVFAWTVLGIHVVRWVLICWAVSSIVGRLAEALLATLARGVSLAAVTAGIVWVVDLGLSRSELGASLRLVADVVAGVLSLMLVLVLARRWIVGSELTRVIINSKGALPAPLWRFLLRSLSPSDA